MSAISLSSFASRAGGVNYNSQAQRGLPSQQAQRGLPGQQSLQSLQAQRGAFYSTSGVGAARGNTGTASASCPTCGGNSNSSSYCPTCNQAGGRQSSPLGVAAYQGGGQGGAVCVGCAYGGR